MTKEELTLERLKLENEQLKLEIKKRRKLIPSWIVFPAMWIVYAVIHHLLTLL